jgi:UDP-glucose 4-epimerase
MRVLVTGAAGFVGSNLVDRLLAEEHEVDAVDDLSSGSLPNLADARTAAQGRLSFHNLDIRSPDLVELMTRRRPEVVFHLAAQSAVKRSVTEPLYDADVNVIGSVNVLEGARQAGSRKVVYAASGGTLYGEPEELPVKESAPHRPLSPYGVSKKAVCDYLVAYRDLYDLEFTALALANVYGPRQDPYGEGGVIAIFAERLVLGEPCIINGDGSHTRDYVFVDDVVDAFARAADKGSGLIINLGTGNQTSNLELYNVLATVAGVDAAPVFGPPRPGDVLHSALDPGRAEIHLGWKPWTDLSVGVGAVLGWVRTRVSERDPRQADAQPRS